MENKQLLHVYHRGIERTDIFFYDTDRQYFLDKLQNLLDPTFDLHAFALMTNHFHLLIRVQDNETIGKKMQVLLSTYVKKINYLKNRRGTIFEGNYKSVEINSMEQYFNEIKYILLNPLKAGMCNSVYYKWNSMSHYFKNSSLINDKYIVDEFKILDNFRKFVEGGNNMLNNSLISNIERENKIILTDDVLIDKILEKFNLRDLNRVTPAYKVKMIKWVSNNFTEANISQLSRIFDVSRTWIRKINES